MKFEEVLTVHVKIEESIELNSDYGDSVKMIPFTGTVTGKYFEGKVLSGGIDTQIIGRFGDRHTLSARYMIEGTDYKGEECKIFIENNGSMDKDIKNALFRTYPKIITNSKALDFLNHDLIVSEGLKEEMGINIKIYRAVE